MIRAPRPLSPFSRTALASLMLAAAACGARPPAERVAPHAGAKADRGAPIEGIDLSDRLDWAAFQTRALATTHRFAYVRIGGQGAQNADFLGNWRGAREAGLLVGAYYWYSPGLHWSVQAQVVIDALVAVGRPAGRLAAGDLPVVLDVEPPLGATLSATQELVDGLGAWVRAIEDATGRPPILYTNYSSWAALGRPEGCTEHPGAFARLPLWVAQYNVAAPLLPETWSGWTFWQHAANTTLPGVAGLVDLNYFAGTMEQLRALAGCAAAPGAPGCTDPPDAPDAPDALDCSAYGAGLYGCNAAHPAAIFHCSPARRWRELACDADGRPGFTCSNDSGRGAACCNPQRCECTLPGTAPAWAMPACEPQCTPGAPDGADRTRLCALGVDGARYWHPRVAGGHLRACAGLGLPADATCRVSADGEAVCQEGGTAAAAGAFARGGFDGPRCYVCAQYADHAQWAEVLCQAP